MQSHYSALFVRELLYTFKVNTMKEISDCVRAAQLTDTLSNEELKTLYLELTKLYLLVEDILEARGIIVQKRMQIAFGNNNL